MPKEKWPNTKGKGMQKHWIIAIHVRQPVMQLYGIHEQHVMHLTVAFHVGCVINKLIIINVLFIHYRYGLDH